MPDMSVSHIFVDIQLWVHAHLDLQTCLTRVLFVTKKQQSTRNFWSVKDTTTGNTDTGIIITCDLISVLIFLSTPKQKSNGM